MFLDTSVRWIHRPSRSGHRASILQACAVNEASVRRYRSEMCSGRWTAPMTLVRTHHHHCRCVRPHLSLSLPVSSTVATSAVSVQLLHESATFRAWYGMELGWLGSRLVSVLDSGAEGPGFKSQSRRCRVTVLGKRSYPSCLYSPSSKIGSSPLKGCGGNCRPGGK